jgi:Uncharacterised protein family (UPF0104).
LPDATPTSTAPRSTARRNKAWIAAQVFVAAIVVTFIGKTLVSQWRAFRGTPLTVDLNWPVIVASAGVVLVTYAVLIETWRQMVRAWGSEISFPNAARIWSVSNLGRYVPGKIWSIGAMTTLAERTGVSPMAAAGSAILNTIVNIATGFLVALVAGWKSFDVLSKGHTGLGAGLLILAIGGVMLLPTLMPRILDLARRLTGRELAIAAIPHRAVYLSLAGNIVAWLLYGAAFKLFVHGVIGTAPGSFADYVTAWAWPYVLGYLVLVAPGGIGVRDGALALALTALGIATPPQAALIMVTSRLWLTVLELLPGLTYMAIGGRPQPKPNR